MSLSKWLHLISRAEDAGAPDMDGGEGFADQLTSAFEEAAGVFEVANDQAAEIPTNDQEAYNEAVTGLDTSMQEALSSVGNGLSAPESEELATAFDDE